MADSTISNLPAGTPAQLTDALPIQRGNSNYKLTVQDLANLLGINNIEGLSQISVSSDTTLTEIARYIVVEPTGSGYKIILPTLAAMSSQLSIGDEFTIINFDLSGNNTIEVCYNDGSSLVTIESRGAFSILLNTLTEGSGLQAVPKFLFGLNENGSVTGFQSFYPSAYTSFTPTDVSGGSINLTNATGAYYTIGKLVFITMSFGYPSESDNTNTAKIGNLPEIFSAAYGNAQAGACTIISSSLNPGNFTFQGIPGQTAGNIVVNNVVVKNEALKSSSITITMVYITD